MNISQESNGALEAIIHIQLNEADYLDSVNKQLIDYRKKASMPGFRPGKVPMGLVKKMYGKGVVAEEVNKSISEALNNYILENKINVLGYPLPNLEKNSTLDFDNQKDFDFYFDIGLAPEFELTLSEDIKIPYYKVKVKEEDIDKAIADVKLRFGTEENPETAEETDGLQGKFSELDNEGNLIEGGVEHTAFFRIEDIKLKTIKTKLTGISGGQAVDFNLMRAFKDEAKVEELLHLHERPEDKMKADYRFEVEKVVRSSEAELGEELYKKVFPAEDYKTEKEFRERISSELQQHGASDSDRQFMADSVNELLKITNLDLPDEFMKRWLVESNEGKITAEQVEEQYDSYTKTIRWQLIEGKLHETFGDDIKVSDEDVRAKVREYFQGVSGETEANPQVDQIVDQVLSNKEERQRIYAGLLDEKITRIFKENLSLKEQEVDSEKFAEIASNTK